MAAAETAIAIETAITNCNAYYNSEAGIAGIRHAPRQFRRILPDKVQA
jgi:hypothetical protein